MPTPVRTAKQCLNIEAFQALDEAVSVARRRGHAQTTSLHAVFALLSLSPSQLKEACVRARNTAFYPRVQLKALDFCLSVSLERLPTSQPRVEEPPVSNSLMAAIKRSQANQRRQPESIIALRNQNQLLGQSQDPLGTSSGVKVELQHLIVSILDDPIVSRVFNDAGFRSFDVKLAILRPFHSFFRYPQRGRGDQGLFLCNLDGSLDSSYRPFPFPFSGHLGNSDGHDNYKRIGEVLVRKKGRNPLLVGVCASDALRGFLEVLERRKELDMLPLEIRGIKVVSFERDVLKFVNEKWSDEAMSLRFRELGMMVEHSLGLGLMLSLGNLRFFLGGENGFGMGVLNSVVRKLTSLLEVQGGKVWLIGFAPNDQTYMEFLRRFPSVDKDWDLHLLPITSVNPLVGGELCFKSSLMGSFVPFGGFFSFPSDLKGPLSSSYHHGTCHNECNENFEQETTAFPKRGLMASVADQHTSTLSPWLQMDELGVNNASNDMKAKGSKMLLNVTERQQSFQLTTGVSSYYCQGKGKTFHTEMHLSPPSSNMVLGRSSKNDLAKISENPSRSNSWQCISGGDDIHTSPSGDSAVTELGLELFPDPHMQKKKENANFDKIHATKHSTQHISSNFKTLNEALFERVRRQSKALRSISQIVAGSCSSNTRLQSSSLRRDIWLNCIGSDLFGKRKIATALANVLYGSDNNFIHVDFYPKYDPFLHTKAFGDQISEVSHLKFRGKTTVDYIAEELRRIPFGIVFLENVHSADPMVQRSLSQAIKSGRFSDSQGREVPINNRIFILTSEDNSTPGREKKSNFPEERIARAKGWPIHVTVKTEKNMHSETSMNKRKINGIHETSKEIGNEDLVKRPNRGSALSLDLNLPAELSDGDDDERFDSWLQELSDKMENALVEVVFDPFDYEALGSEILKWVHQSLCKAVGFGCLLEIEPRVMDQILAAACLSDDEKEVKDWIDQVLSKGFAQVQTRYQLTPHSVVAVNSCGSHHTEELAPGTCLLPSKIVLI